MLLRNTIAYFTKHPIEAKFCVQNKGRFGSVDVLVHRPVCVSMQLSPNHSNISFLTILEAREMCHERISIISVVLMCVHGSDLCTYQVCLE